MSCNSGCGTSCPSGTVPSSRSGGNIAYLSQQVRDMFNSNWDLYAEGISKQLNDMQNKLDELEPLLAEIKASKAYIASVETNVNNILHQCEELSNLMQSKIADGQGINGEFTSKDGKTIKIKNGIIVKVEG